MPVKPLPPTPLISPRFRSVFGDSFADFIEGVAQKVTKSKIDSVGRERATGVTQGQGELEQAQRQPNRPPEEPKHWLDELDDK